MDSRLSGRERRQGRLESRTEKKFHGKMRKDKEEKKGRLLKRKKEKRKKKKRSKKTAENDQGSYNADGAEALLHEVHVGAVVGRAVAGRLLGQRALHPLVQLKGDGGKAGNPRVHHELLQVWPVARLAFEASSVGEKEW